MTFPVGQPPGFHAPHSEDEGFFKIEGQLTVTVLDDEGERHTLVTDPGELVWGPTNYAHSYHVTSDVPCKTIIALVPGSTLPGYFAAVQNLELDPTDEAAVQAFVEECNQRWGLELFPNIPLDD